MLFADNYLLGYDWGKVEAFVDKERVTIHCVPRDPPGMLYEAIINRKERNLVRERSYIPDESRSKFLRSKDCDNPAELRPRLKNMLDDLPRDVKNLVEEVLVN